MGAELMSGCRQMRGGDDSLRLTSFPNKNLILKHYMLGAWWLQLLDGLGHYVMCPREIEELLLMNNIITNLGYTYDKYRLKKPPEIVYKLTHTRRIFT